MCVSVGGVMVLVVSGGVGLRRAIPVSMAQERDGCMCCGCRDMPPMIHWYSWAALQHLPLAGCLNPLLPLLLPPPPWLPDVVVHGGAEAAAQRAPGLQEGGGGPAHRPPGAGEVQVRRSGGCGWWCWGGAGTW